MTDPATAFIAANTAVARPPIVPEIALYLASEITPIWHATESALEANDVPPPFWAFCWPGGQALARHILDHQELVQGRRVLDFAAGCGVAAIAAALSGAGHVAANDIDDHAMAAVRMNAGLNQVAIEEVRGNLVGGPGGGWDLVVAGDVCYERPMSGDVTSWLRGLAADGAEVLMGDPGRNFLPDDGLLEVARYDVPTSRELEDRETRTTVIWRVMAEG